MPFTGLGVELRLLSVQMNQDPLYEQFMRALFQPFPASILILTYRISYFLPSCSSGSGVLVEVAVLRVRVISPRSGEFPSMSGQASSPLQAVKESKISKSLFQTDFNPPVPFLRKRVLRLRN